MVVSLIPIKIRDFIECQWKYEIFPDIVSWIRYTSMNRMKGSRWNWFGLIWFGFMAHQPLLVIHAESIFIHINNLFQTIQFSISKQFQGQKKRSISNNSVEHNYIISMAKTILFLTIQFSISIQFSSIWPIDSTLSGTTTPGQSGLGSDSNEGVLRLPQRSIINGTSPSDSLVSHTGHLLGRVLPLCREEFGVFYSPSRLGNDRNVMTITTKMSTTVLIMIIFFMFVKD